jgi:hypothetical protein
LISTFLLIFLSVASPNIAFEQYESSLSDEEWESELQKFANPEDSELAQLEDLEKWTEFYNQPHDGKMFKSECNSIGVCEYFWIDPPDLTFNVTSQFGETRLVSVTCGDGTFANYSALECQQTKESIILNEQIKVAIIALTALAVISIVGVVVYIKLKRLGDSED